MSILKTYFKFQNTDCLLLIAYYSLPIIYYPYLIIKIGGQNYAFLTLFQIKNIIYAYDAAYIETFGIITTDIPSISAIFPFYRIQKTRA